MNTTRTLLAATLTVLAMAGAQACETDAGPLTRDQVRAELSDARALGLLDQPGEAGATDAVLAAREAHNALETLVLQACMTFEAQQVSAAGGESQPDLGVYFEAGPHGPLMVLVTFEGDGHVHSADTLMLTVATLD